METLAQRLKRLRVERGLSQAKLGTAAGVSQSTIGNIESGTRGYGDSVVAIAAALGVQPGYLTLQLDAPHEQSNVTAGPASKGAGRYPLISWVQAGEWTDICDNFQPGSADEWPSSHHDLGKCGYFLRVQGDSMTAPPGSPYSFPPGVLLHVHPEREPMPGQFVIVRRTSENEATFKRLALVDGELFLEAINPDWPRRYLPLKEGDVFCGVVVDASFGNLP